MIAEHVLHGLAWVSLRCLPPRRAAAAVRRTAALLPPLEVEQAIFVNRNLRLGNCLSRALAVSARLPGSKIALGVRHLRPFEAHAWVEVDGVPIDPVEDGGGRLAHLA